jgi:hypothetical protein
MFIVVVGSFTLVGWGLMKTTEGRNEDVVRRFGDSKTEEEKKVYNETQLMYSILRGGGQPSLRWV